MTHQRPCIFSDCRNINECRNLGQCYFLAGVAKSIEANLEAALKDLAEDKSFSDAVKQYGEAA